MDYIRLSKTISHALRHAPWEYELEMDENGWVLITQLLYSLREEKRWENLKEEDIYHVVETSDKSRFEMLEGRIRALYGHSLPNRIVKEAAEPPEILYHGTTRNFASLILDNGLQPKGRQYVHMAVDTEMALQVGRRRDQSPVLLKIHAGKAWSEGVAFYKGNDRVWLADYIDGKYIEMA